MMRRVCLSLLFFALCGFLACDDESVGDGEVADEGFVPDEDFRFVDDEMVEEGPFSGGQVVEMTFGHLY